MGPSLFLKQAQVVDIGLVIDISDQRNDWQNEVVPFDGSHSRCHGFKTLGLWVYHPEMQSLLWLVTVKIWTES